MLYNKLYLGNKPIIKSYLGTKLIMNNNNDNPNDTLKVPEGWLDIRRGMTDGTPQINMLYAYYNTPIICFDIAGHTEDSVINIDWGDGTSDSYTGNTVVRFTHDYTNSVPIKTAIFKDKECNQFKIQITGDIRLFASRRTNYSGYQNSNIVWLEADCTGMRNAPEMNCGTMYTTELVLPLLQIYRLKNTNTVTNFLQIVRKAYNLEILEFDFGTNRKSTFELNGSINIPCIETFIKDCSMCTNFSSLSSCKNLKSVNLGRLDNIKTLSIYNNPNLTEFEFSFKEDAVASSYTFNLQSNNFDGDTLNSIMNRLPTTDGTSCKLTITGNPGVDTCDITIAENKGWTVIYSS